MSNDIFHVNKKLKIENYNENYNEINDKNKDEKSNKTNIGNEINNNKKINKNNKNKKINFIKLINYQQINFYNNKYIKKIQNKYFDKYDEFKSKNNSEYCIEDHTFKYYPFINNGTCRFCLKKKPKSEKELLNESYHELF